MDNFNLQTTINEFIEEKLIEGYRTNLNTFCEFLKVKGITNEVIKTTFQGLRSEFLIESLDYYVNNKKITSFGASLKYASCMKEYFVYLVQNENVKNDELMAEFTYKTHNEKSYRYKVNNYLGKKDDIIKGEGFEVFDEVEALIEDCNETMDDEYILKRLLTHLTYFNKYRSALMIKLILLTGNPYRSLIRFQTTDLDLPHCLITVNGFTIHLPYKLTEQLRVYLVARNTIANNHNLKSESLFINYEGTEMRPTTSTIAGFLKDLTARGDLNGLIKYSVTNMVKKGINQSIIIKFTNVGDSIYEQCQEKVNKEMIPNANRYLDSKILSLELFDLL